MSGASTPTPGSRGIDPKDRIAAWSPIEEGIDASASDPATATAAFERALALDPGNGLAMKYLGDVSFRTGRLRDAQAGYMRALAAGLSHPDVFVNLASIAEREHRLADAGAMLEQAARLAPADADVWNRLGLLEARRNRLGPAADAFAKAIDAAPTRAEPYYNAALIARRAGRESEAQAQARGRSNGIRTYADAHYELATGYLAAGDPQAALARLPEGAPDSARLRGGPVRRRTRGARSGAPGRSETRLRAFVRVAPHGLCGTGRGRPAHDPRLSAASRSDSVTTPAPAAVSRRSSPRRTSPVDCSGRAR